MSRPRRNKNIERELMDAIDRLVAAGEDVNNSSVAREAKRARGILSKRGSGYSAVVNRIVQIQAEASPTSVAVSKTYCHSSRNEVEALRKANRELKREVKHVRSSLVALLAAQADMDWREPQVADMQRRQAARAERLAVERVLS